MERKWCSLRTDASWAVRPRGVHTWAKSGLAILGPITPTMAYGSPSKLMDLPTTLGSEA